jgi:hypothetical protein
LCGSLLLLSLFVLTVQVYDSERLGAAVVALALTLPVIAAGSSIMTIDAPYTCCWGWALVAGHRAVFRGSGWAWPVAGLLVGLGILAKYTMILWVPSLGLFLLASPGYRRLLVRPGFWVMSAVGAACCLPILLWNLRHDWVSLRHVGGQAGIHQPAGLRWLGPLNFLGTQAALLLGIWFVAWLRAMVASRPCKEPNAGAAYLWWMSALMFAFFLAFSFKTGGGEANWPVTAYLSGTVLTAAWLVTQLRAPRPGYRRLVAWSVAAACTLGMAVTVLMHYSTLAQPLLAKVSGPPTAQHPLPLRRFDPTCRLRGWRTLAARVDAIRARLKDEGIDPVLAGSAWSLPGELGFYCRGHPTVFSLGLALGDRHSQYDFWRPNPVQDSERFSGRTIILVGDPHPLLPLFFRSLDPAEVVNHREKGQPVARWKVTVCRGFRGFPPWLSAGFGGSF